MLNKKANPILLKMEKAVTAKVPKHQMQAFRKIITAGTKVMYSENMHKMLVEQLKSPGDSADMAGEGVAKLMGILITQSKGTMPMQAGSPAAAVLLCEALDMMEQLGKVKVTNDILAQAVQTMSSGILRLFGVTPQRLDQMMTEARQKQQASQPPQAEAQPQQTAQPAPQGAQPLIGAPA